MSSVYSIRALALADEIEGGYTVPEEYVFIARDLDVYYRGPAGGSIVFIGAAGQTIWQAQFTGPTPIGSAQWQGRQVFNPGESLQVVSTVLSDFTLSGYLLLAP